MPKTVIRKTVVPTADDEYKINTYLARKNRQRRRSGERAYSFNALALDAIREKIDREQQRVAA